MYSPGHQCRWFVLVNVDVLLTLKVVFQLTIIGIVGLKKAPVAAALLVPLPIITILFHSYCLRFLNAKARFLPAFEAKKSDDNDELHKDAYLQPSLGPLMQPEFMEQDASVKNMSRRSSLNVISV